MLRTITHTKSILLLLVITALLLPDVSRAQQTVPQNAPLLLLSAGDLWTWTAKQGKLARRTNWGYNNVPVVAPDARQIAYKSTATVAVDAIKKSGGMGGGELPSNIWLMDIASGNALRVADQPPGAAILTGKDKYTVRSTPTWSPDGKALAWTQRVMDTANNQSEQIQLAVYNLETKTDAIYTLALPPQYGVPTAIPAQWGSPGIAIWSTTWDTSSGQGVVKETIYIFGKDGKQIAAHNIPGLQEFGWIKEGDREYLAVFGKSGQQGSEAAQWLLIEPATGRTFAMPGVPELYSLLTPNGYTVFPQSMNVAPEWAIGAPDKSAVKLGTIDDVYTFSRAVTISPDGQQVAYVQQGAAYVFAGGKITQIATADIVALGWGPVGWRVRRRMG